MYDYLTGSAGPDMVVLMPYLPCHVSAQNLLQVALPVLVTEYVKKVGQAFTGRNRRHGRSFFSRFCIC
jgi:hypothetical protein